MPSVLTRIELDIEEMVAHIRDILTKNPNAEVHINPPAQAAITVAGKAHPNTAGSEPGGPGHGK